MAQDSIKVQAEIDPDSELGREWRKHSESFELCSEATRTALHESLVEKKTNEVNRGVRAGLVTLLVLFLGQAHLVYGPAVSMPLVGTALLAFAIVLVVPQPLTDLFSRGTHE